MREDYRKDPSKQKAIAARYYRRHKTRLLAERKAAREVNQQLLNVAKSTPCSDCGVSYLPFVMDFDHVRGRKEFQIGGSLHLSTKRLLTEIGKCDVVCSNCHRFRTFGRAPVSGTTSANELSVNLRT